jgi:hypothetical protein
MFTSVRLNCERLFQPESRVMVDLLRTMMTGILEDLADLPTKLTENPDGVDGENGAPLRQDDGGPTDVG